jgi:uncharacterized protein
MKKIITFTISFYQNLVSPAIKNILGINKMCRFSPTCSEYVKTSINKDGILLGFRKSAVRILRCQPFFKF